MGATIAVVNHSVRKIIIFLFLLNFITGLIFLNDGLFHADSVILAQAIENTYHTCVLQPAVRGRYGSVIINTIFYLPFFILGYNADFTVRFTSILFHSLSVVILFLFIRELFNDHIQALFTSLLLSFTPFYFSPNTYGKEHGLSIFVLILSLYLLYRGMNKKSLSMVAISSFLIGFSITIRESSLTTAPLYFLLYFSPGISIHPLKIFFPRERFNPKMLLCVAVPFLLVFLFTFFTYLRNVIYESVIMQGYSSSHFVGSLSYLLRYALRDILFAIPFPLFVFFLVGIWKMFSDKKVFFASFFLLWCMLFFYVGNVNSYNSRYLDIVIIPIYTFASYELSRFYKVNKVITLAVIACFVFTMFLAMYPMLRFRHVYNGPKQFALYVKEKTDDNAIVIAIDDSPFIEYYGKRKTLAPPVADPGKNEYFVKTIKGYLSRNIPVYLIESGLFYDVDGIFKKSLNENFNINKVGKKLSEDYHRAEIRFKFYLQKLFRVSSKEIG